MDEGRKAVRDRMADDAVLVGGWGHRRLALYLIDAPKRLCRAPPSGGSARPGMETALWPPAPCRIQQRVQPGQPDLHALGQLIGRIDDQQAGAVERHPRIARIEPELARSAWDARRLSWSRACQVARSRSDLMGYQAAMTPVAKRPSDSAIADSTRVKSWCLLVRRIDEGEAAALGWRQVSAQQRVAISTLDSGLGRRDRALLEHAALAGIDLDEDAAILRAQLRARPAGASRDRRAARCAIVRNVCDDIRVVPQLFAIMWRPP